MNEMQVFNNPTVAELKTAFTYDKESVLGFFYLLEYGEGLKIGSTNNPANRFSSLSRAATKYGILETGAFAVSQPHTNFRENEAYLHKLFDAFRVPGTELFSVSLEQAKTLIATAPIKYRDDSEEINADAVKTCEYLKDLTGLGEAVNSLNALRMKPSVATNGNALQFCNDQSGETIRIIKNEDGSILINAEDAATGLGWCQDKGGVKYVRWDRLNRFCAELGFSPQVGKDDFIPEPLFYMLAMKANNDNALRFQKWIAFDVVPSLRKTGKYAVPTVPSEESRLLTSDDYLTAARILSSCRNERLPYVLPLIRKAGIDIELVTSFPATRANDKDPNTARLLNDALNDYHVSIRALERLTGIDNVQLYRMKNGTSRYNAARAAIIREVIHTFVPELDMSEYAE